MAASNVSLVDRVLKEFNPLTSKPENFLSVQPDSCSKFKVITKDLYDSINQNFTVKGLTGSLPELYIEGFEEEQIWQQLELHNEPCFNILMKDVAKLLSGQNKKLTFIKDVVQTPDNEEDEEEEEEKEDERKEGDKASDDVSELSFGDDSDHENEDDWDSDGYDDLKLDDYRVLDEERGEKSKKTQREEKFRKTEVDDQFFKVGEMEKFLEKEEAIKPARDEDEESFDYFEDIPSDDEENEAAIRAKYKDFFKGSGKDGDRQQMSEEMEDDENLDEEEEEEESDEEDEDGEPNEKRVKFNFDDSESEDSDSPQKSNKKLSDPNVKSSFELREERLKAKIQELEEEAVAPKSWQLLGETKADLRPENALLEEDLVFEHTTRQAPVITEETTKTLEEIIRQRIKDQAFDDVERKVKPVVDPTEFKKKLVLDQEKSKFSLSEIYEQEYLQKQEQAEQNAPKQSSLADPLNNEVATEAAHIEIRNRMHTLFSQLDALCNFFYTPRMPLPEIKVVSNMPSIAMEDVAPTTVSDANLLAPQEVLDSVRGALKGDSEKDKTDRLRGRRKKKSAQRLRYKEKERNRKAVEKANPGMGNRHAKERVLRDLKTAEKEGTVSLIKDSRSKVPKSSTAFFQRLQDDVSATVNSIKQSKMQKGSKVARKSVSQLKL